MTGYICQPCQNVSCTFTKVIDFCTYYQTVEKINDIVPPFKEKDDTVLKIIKQQWYADFVKNENIEDFKTINKLIAVAIFMKIGFIFNEFIKKLCP